MAFDISDFFKKLMGSHDDENDPTLPQQGPVPQARPQNVLLADPTQTASVDPAAPEEPAAPHSANPLRNLLLKMQPDEDKANDIAMALIQGGAGAMIAGGPSSTPTNFLQVLGSGLGSGAKAYQNARKDGSDIRLQDVQSSAARAKITASQANAAASANIGAPGPNGWSIEQLYAIWQQQWAHGDEAGARLTQEQIQQKQQTAAKNSQSFDDNGNIINAPGVVAAQTEEEHGKAVGRTQGEESAKQTDDIREYNNYVDQENSAGRTPQEFDPWLKGQKASGAAKTTINNDDGAGRGAVFKLMTDQSTAAAGAVKGNKALSEARTLLDQGVITGTGAEQILKLQKMGRALGIVDADKITNTEAFKGAVVPIVANVLHSTVGTANISDSDRKFAEQFAGGNITLDETSMRRIFSIIEKANNATISDYNSRLDKVYPDDENHTYAKERAVLSLPNSEQGTTTSDRLLGGSSNGASNAPQVVTTKEALRKLKPGTRFTNAIEGDPNFGKSGTR